MPLLAQKQIRNITLLAIEHEGHAYVRVSLSNPCRSVSAVAVDKPMRTTSNAAHFVENADVGAMERGESMVMDLCGDFMRKLDRALTTPISEINAQIMRFDRKV